MRHTAYYPSPIGTVTITGEDGFITSLYVNREKPEENANLPAYMASAIAQLDDYFHGKLMQFSLPIRSHAPSFTQRAWDALREIPYGKRRSYGEIAKAIGNPKAARAIGNACNRNPLPLIVPCHRVVGSAGEMTGFALGIETKAWLLSHEQRIAEAA